VGTKGLDKVAKGAKVGDKLTDLGQDIQIGISSSRKITPNDIGPLHEVLGEVKAKEVISTFRGGTYTVTTLDDSITLYRVIPKDGKRDGSYWSVTPPEGALKSLIDGSIDLKFGNKASEVVVAKIPKGTTIYHGVTEWQKRFDPTKDGNRFSDFVGGGNQVYLPKVDPLWILPKTNPKTSSLRASSVGLGLMASQTSTIDPLTGTPRTASLVGTDADTQMAQSRVVPSFPGWTSLYGLSEMSISDYLESPYMMAHYHAEPKDPILPNSSFNLPEPSPS